MSLPGSPNFFVVGAAKAGTTSLHRYLSQHPQIYMSPVKEPCFFADEIRPAKLSVVTQRHVRQQSKALPGVLGDGRPTGEMGWIASDWEEYRRLFAKASGERAIGEASAAYLWSETAAENIRRYREDARIIMILRDPAERAFSQYLHQLSVGLTRDTFAGHLRDCLHASHRELGITYPFLEMGLYCEQVRRYLSRFPRDQIRIYWYEEAWRQPHQFLADVFRFLDVDAGFVPDTSTRNLERRAPRFASLHYLLKRSGLWRPLRALAPSKWKHLAFRDAGSLTMDPADRRFLVEFYRPDIQQLAQLLDRDLSHWLR